MTGRGLCIRAGTSSPATPPREGWRQKERVRACVVRRRGSRLDSPGRDWGRNGRSGSRRRDAGNYGRQGRLFWPMGVSCFERR